MNHYLLTRSAYGPEWSREANERRFAITDGVTINAMANQTVSDWTWIVLLDPRDEMLELRRARYLAVQQVGIRVVPLLWFTPDVAAAPWDRNAARTTPAQQAAATAYRAPWREDGRIPVDQPALMTRIDDDDAFVPDALERIQRAAALVPEGDRRILVQPRGFRVSNGKYVRVVHPSNAMHSLVTPTGDRLCIYDYGHTLVAAGGYRDELLGEAPADPPVVSGYASPAPVTKVDDQAAWLWVRHVDAISRDLAGVRPISKQLRAMFPIDWSLLA